MRRFQGSRQYVAPANFRQSVKRRGGVVQRENDVHAESYPLWSHVR